MSCSPMIPYGTERKLKEISPYLQAKWSSHLEKWEIWFICSTAESPPYIIMTVPQITAETYLDLRRSFWWSKKIKYNMNVMNEKLEQRTAKTLADEEDEHMEMGKEIAPLLRTMKDAGTSSHGSSKTKFSGYGAGGN